MQIFRPSNEISRKHSKNGLMQSGRKRCTRRTAAPAGAGIAPGSGADELRGCTSPLCVRTQNPKPWYELPMSGDANITPAPPSGICGQCRSLRKHRSAEQKRGAGGRDRLRASPRTPQTQKHRTTHPARRVRTQTAPHIPCATGTAAPIPRPHANTFIPKHAFAVKIHSPYGELRREH